MRQPERCYSVPSAAGAFDIVVGAEADDGICQAIARGQCPHHPLVDLLLQTAGPGATVLDLGAHVGTFCLPAAAAGCRVLAVEASPRNAALLQASAERNGFTRLRVVHAAAADRPGTLAFSPHGPFGHVATPATNLPSVEVRAVTVDGLLTEVGWGRVDFVKMDVEGSEPAAVRGMARLLARPDAPPVCYEGNGHTLHFYGQAPAALKAALETFGYRNYLVEPGRLVPVEAHDLQAEAVADYLAVKHPPTGLRGWRVTGPRPRREALDRIRAACAHPHEHFRAHVARELRHAPPDLLANRSVRRALRRLQADPDPEVRQAAAWSQALTRSAGWIDRLHRLCRRAA